MTRRPGQVFASFIDCFPVGASDVADSEKAIAAAVDLGDQESYSPRPIAECDVVMKGGITSGVIYPLAVCRIAKDYGLRNVGGSSAGAIAAAAAAAAERGRASRGFVKLASLPDELGDRLGSLFVAQRRTRPLMKVLLASLHPKRSGLLKAVGIAWAAVSTQVQWALLGLVVALVPAAATAIVAAGVPEDRQDWLWVARALIPMAPLAVITAMVLVLVGLGRKLMKNVPKNYFGLCTGMSAMRGEGSPGLTEWLSAKLDDLAGLPVGQRPLTFEDLWGPRATQVYRDRKNDGKELSAEDRRLRKIDLEVMTTDLGRGRPWRVPFSEDRFAFCPTEFRDLFPEYVVCQMCNSPGVWMLGPSAVRCPTHGDELYRLPDAPDLPVVFAARISLSFPMLISAIPLYSIDYTNPDAEARDPSRSWFSDGGMSSNFPIHFFDSMWPSRPTFGVNLAKFHPAYPETLAYYPGPSGGTQFAVRSISKLFDFVAAIADTMQNWSDRGQMRIPGFRERIVTVHHTKLEGGMNLSMPPKRISSLATRGAFAAHELVTRFRFDKHRWNRYRLAMGELEQALEAMHHDYVKALADGPSYSDFIAVGGEVATEPHRWVNWAADQTAMLMDYADDLGAGAFGFAQQAPRPDPDLRITPRF